MSETKMVEAKVLFGLEDSNTGTKLPVREPTEFTPKEVPHYRFRLEMLRPVLYWIFSNQQNNLFLHGPTGCGKTTLVEATAAKLGLEVFKASGHNRLEFRELMGTYIKGGHEYVEGPLSMAMKRGGIFLLDEGDLLSPGEAMGLNAALDGRAILNTDTGEKIDPHPDFRIAITGNSAGSGDRDRIYKGVTPQNPAWLDRSISLTVDYMPPEDELVVLRAAVPNVDQVFIEAMIRVANEVRALFKGAVETGMTHTISTRTLVLWAQMTAAFVGASDSPVMDSLAPAFLNRLDPDQAQAVKGICQRVFGKSV